MFSEIKRVDIEFHSKCNRICEWCPNKTIDRKNKNDQFLDKNIFIKLMQDLYDNNFGIKSLKKNKDFLNIISFLGYQEPFLAVDELQEYLNIARQIFKDRNIKFTTNSNGDYITTDNLNQLKLNELNIMDYDCKGKEYWKNWLISKQCCLIKEEENTLIAIHNTINIVRIMLNWPKNIELENRGGYFNKNSLSSNYKWKNNCELRTEPCFEPLNYLNIYSDGSVMPCCHLRPDNVNHKDYIMGNLYENSIVEIYTNNNFNNFRNIIKEKKFPEPCKYCQKIRPELILSNQNTNNQNTVFRANEEWNAHQEKIWQNISTYYYRTEINGKKYPLSFYYINNKLFDINLVKNLYSIYEKNLMQLKEVYNFKYINTKNSHLTDHHGGISFDNFSFSLDSMAEQFCNQKGFYQPFLAYNNLRKGEIVICGGRHRLVVLNLLNTMKYEHNMEFLCLFLDDKKQEQLDINLIFPKDLYILIKDLNIKTSDYDLNNFSLKITNYIDCWICLKILEREMDLIIELYYDELLKNNILPSPIINQHCERNKDE